MLTVHWDSCFRSTKMQTNTLKQAILIHQTLTNFGLKKVLQNQCAALVVPNYISQDACFSLANNLQKSALPSVPYYHEESDEKRGKTYHYYGVDRIGLPYNTVYNTQHTSKERQTYFEQCKQCMQQLRLLSAPHFFPMDKLRLDLDENWYVL